MSVKTPAPDQQANLNATITTDDDLIQGRSKRFYTKELAQLEVYGRMGKIFCKMANLSQSGAFFEIINSNYIPRSGDLVRITILLRQLNKTHLLDAEIIWCKGLGFGLSFLTRENLLSKLYNRGNV